MLRFDPSKHDQFKYLVFKKSIEAVSSREGKRSKVLPAASASKEKFYQVSDSVKAVFKQKENQPNEFSVLKLYGRQDDKSKTESGAAKEDKDDTQESDNEYEDEAQVADNYNTSKERENDFKTGAESRIESEKEIALGIWKESFFLKKKDPRLEGLHIEINFIITISSLVFDFQFSSN